MRPYCQLVIVRDYMLYKDRDSFLFMSYHPLSNKVTSTMVNSLNACWIELQRNVYKNNTQKSNEYSNTMVTFQVSRRMGEREAGMKIPGRELRAQDTSCVSKGRCVGLRAAWLGPEVPLLPAEHTARTLSIQVEDLTYLKAFMSLGLRVRKGFTDDFNQHLSPQKIPLQNMLKRLAVT